MFWLCVSALGSRAAFVVALSFKLKAETLISGKFSDWPLNEEPPGDHIFPHGIFNIKKSYEKLLVFL
jgi:hypothetical protein